ncbi:MULTISPECIES: hypothetical protein [unclassified Chamaesiphon]|uniref:hypothetical protein n=1 Tax=unclassified Chamaesiphon TaxID=2620921 RepID=UPI00286B0F79|nr:MULTISPECIES: hypothetical protein [unclassified Chamaesiphon]
MSGHHPFQRLVENLPEDRKLEIERKKKELLAAIELREAIAVTAANWRVDTSKTPIENVDIYLSYLRQAIGNLGGELTITAKFPDMVEVEIDSLQSSLN